MHLYNLLKGLKFVVELAALKADEAVGSGVMLRGGEVLTHNLHQVGQWHDGSAHHEVELSTFLFASQMLGLYVLQAYGLGHFSGHPYLLARAIDELKLAFGEHDG